MGSLFDLAVMTVSSAPGTSGTIPLGSAATISGVGYVTFGSAGATTGTVLDYSILDPVNGGSEIGTATYQSSTLTLTSRTPTISTNSNAAINASSGAVIRISPRAETLQNAALFTAGVVETARLGSGTASSSTALFGDQTYKALAAVAESGSASDITTGTLPIARLATNIIPVAWAVITGSTGAITASYGMTSCVRNSTGLYTFTMSSTRPSTNYAVIGSIESSSAANGWFQVYNGSKTTTTFQAQAVDQVPALFDPTSLSVLVFAAS